MEAIRRRISLSLNHQFNNRTRLLVVTRVRGRESLLTIGNIMEMVAPRNKQRPAVEGTALFSPDMGWGGEWFWQTLVGAGFGVEYFGPPCFTFVHDA